MPAESLNGKTPLPVCGYYQVFEAIAKDTIFTRLTPQTTKEQYEQVQECLVLLRNELQRRLDWRHFPSATGPPHRCLADCCLEAVFRLKNLSLLAPKAPIDAPKPRVLSPEDVVDNLGVTLSLLAQQGLTLPKETHLGREER